MISIIVCSRSEDFFNSLVQNIEATVGIPFEIICIDNSSGKYGICSAYNEGASRANFHWLCFVHEDVSFKTNGWGKMLIAHFNELPDAGIIGIAGAIYKSRMPCGWWQAEAGMDEIKRINIIQTSLARSSDIKHLYYNPFKEIRSAVVVLDGVFMATTKEVWNRNRFDDKMFNGFHGYDLDFSFRVLQTKSLFVVYDILLEHYSVGIRDMVWLNAMMLVHEKWKKKLPFFAGAYSVEPIIAYHFSWKRLRKNMAAFMNAGTGFARLLQIYNRYFSLLDNKPGIPTLYKHYIAGLVNIIIIAFARKSVSD